MLSIYLSFYLPIYLPYLEVGDYIWYSIKAFKVFDIIRGTLYNKFTNKLSFSLWYFWFDSNAMQPDCASVPKPPPQTCLDLDTDLLKCYARRNHQHFHHHPLIISSQFSSSYHHHISLVQITPQIIIGSHLGFSYFGMVDQHASRWNRVLCAVLCSLYLY